MAAVLGISGLEGAEQVGSDGFVTTYRARDAVLGQMVTVEVLPPITGSDEALARYEETLRALYVKPRHPAILPIHELGQLEDGRPYVVTLRATTQSLADRAGTTPLGSAEVAAVGATLADALAVAHERGVVHGDVRLEHIRLTERGDPVLGAFGYDRLARTLRTDRSTLVTSLTNASPEMLDGAEPDAAADVWALSCCLHQLLTGRSPFGLSGSPSLPEIVDRVLHQPLEDLRAAGVADDLATVLEAALQRDRQTRLATAASLRRALRGVGRIHGQGRGTPPAPAPAPAPSSASPPPPPLPPPPPPSPPSLPVSGHSPTVATQTQPPDAEARNPEVGSTWGTSPPEPDRVSVGEEARARRQVVILLGIAVVLLGILAVALGSLIG